jgi:hypothetical protein
MRPLEIPLPQAVFFIDDTNAILRVMNAEPPVPNDPKAHNEQDDAGMRAKAESILQQYNTKRKQDSFEKFFFDWSAIFTHSKHRYDKSDSPKTIVSVKVFAVTIVILAVLYFGGFALLHMIIGN